MKHSHRWIVFSTLLDKVWLLVMCECGDVGAVKDPTDEEWMKAYHAPSSPYPWLEPDRVDVLEGWTSVQDKDHKVWRVVKG